MRRAADLGSGRRKSGKSGSRIQGILVVDKPEGLTSHDVVQKVRRIYGIRQVGHTGTLDPIASGVLVLLVGSATRIAQYLQEDDKEYHLTLRLGIETDTQDISGTIQSEKDPAAVKREDLEEAVKRYEGNFLQAPPPFSAVKRSGQPLYRLARKGVRVETDPREVTIYRIAVTQCVMPRISLEVVCSKGTYMRTLCHDIGKDLGVGGCMESLVRVRSGLFTLGDAVNLERIASEPEPLQWLKGAAGGLGFETFEPEEEDLVRITEGGEIPWPGPNERGNISITRKGRLIAIARIRDREGRKMLSPSRVLEPDFKELFKTDMK
jgi:tRNA pseudouridine55 synthase